MTEPNNQPVRPGTSADSAGAARHTPVPKPSTQLDRFWRAGPELDGIEVHIEPPEAPVELLERLGQSPFQRGRFPLIGFLATTYEKVSRFALERR